MFTFLKKLFGVDNKTMADAGVQIEQIAPTIEAAAPVVIEEVKTAVIEVPVKQEVPIKKSQAKKPAQPKQTGTKPSVQKPAGRKPRGRKPTAK